MKTFALACAGVCALSATSLAGVVSVPGTANIFGAGHAVPPDPNGGGGGTLPVLEVVTPPATGAFFSFPIVEGEVSCCGDDGAYNGPDGGLFASGNTRIESFGGISGIIHDGATMFLVGVFLGPSEPVDPAPARLDFTGATNFASIAPLLNQTFFIGDGRRSDSSLQQFFVPDGATRLFLGFADAFEFGNPDFPPGYYNDNFGELRVEAVQVPGVNAAVVIAALAAGARRRRA